MRLRKISIALGASITAVAAFAANSASAGLAYPGSLFERGGHQLLNALPACGPVSA